MDKTFPKVLVLAQNKIQPFSGGGVLLSNLFGSFPRDHVMFFHREQFYNFDTNHIEVRLKARWLKFSPLAFFRHMRIWLKHLSKNRKLSRLSDFKYMMVQSCSFQLPMRLDRQVRSFKPDIIYAWTGDRLWSETTIAFSNKYSIPYVIHFMDNHVEKTANTPSEFALASEFKASLDVAVCGAKAIFVISDAMGLAYGSRWAKPYEVFRGMIDPFDWPKQSVQKQKRVNQQTKKTDRFIFSFFGSMEEGQLLGIIDVATIIEEMNDNGFNIKLNVYLTEHYRNFAQPKIIKFQCVEIQPHPNSSNFRQKCFESDAMLLAYGFDNETCEYYRYSFATKIVPYMMSSRPILAYGPEKIEPINYVLSGDWAIVVTEEKRMNHGSALKEAINKLYNDEKLRQKLASKAWRHGFVEHNIYKNAEKFRLSLLSKIGLISEK